MLDHYLVEVGVLVKDAETGYEVAFDYEGEQHHLFVYDEDLVTYGSLQEAKEYADIYVKEGVPGTYAYVWASDRTAIYAGEKILYFIHN